MQFFLVNPRTYQLPANITLNSKKLNVVITLCSVTQLCPALCNSMDCSPPCFSIHGIFLLRILEWVAIPTLGDLPNPGSKPASPMSPVLAGGFFTRATCCCCSVPSVVPNSLQPHGLQHVRPPCPSPSPGACSN